MVNYFTRLENAVYRDAMYDLAGDSVISESEALRYDRISIIMEINRDLWIKNIPKKNLCGGNCQCDNPKCISGENNCAEDECSAKNDSDNSSGLDEKLDDYKKNWNIDGK